MQISKHFIFIFCFDLKIFTIYPFKMSINSTRTSKLRKKIEISFDFFLFIFFFTTPEKAITLIWINLFFYPLLIVCRLLLFFNQTFSYSLYFLFKRETDMFLWKYLKRRKKRNLFSVFPSDLLFSFFKGDNESI